MNSAPPRSFLVLEFLTSSRPTKSMVRLLDLQGFQKHQLQPRSVTGEARLGVVCTVVRKMDEIRERWSIGVWVCVCGPGWATTQKQRKT